MARKMAAKSKAAPKHKETQKTCSYSCKYKQEPKTTPTMPQWNIYLSSSALAASCLFCAELLGLGLVAQAGEQGRNGSSGMPKVSLLENNVSQSWTSTSVSFLAFCVLLGDVFSCFDFVQFGQIWSQKLQLGAARAQRPTMPIRKIRNFYTRPLRCMFFCCHVAALHVACTLSGSRRSAIFKIEGVDKSSLANDDMKQQLLEEILTMCELRFGHARQTQLHDKV